MAAPPESPAEAPVQPVVVVESDPPNPPPLSLAGADALAAVSDPVAELTSEPERVSEPEASLTHTRRGRGRRGSGGRRTAEPAETDGEDVGAAVVEQLEAAPEAPQTATDSWGIARPYEIGPDGRVRYLDEPSRPAVSISPPPAEQEPVEPAPLSQELPAREQRRPDAAAEADAGNQAVDAVIFVEADAAVTHVADRAEAPAGADAEIDVATGDESFAPDLPEADAGAEEHEQGDDAPRRRRRSRRGGRGRNRNGQRPELSLVTEDDTLGEFAEDGETVEAAEAETGSLPEVEEPSAEAPVSLPAARERRQPSPSSLSPLEALVARQNVILDQLLQRQAAMAKSMEQALKAVESRLAGTDLSRVSAMPRLAVFVDVPNIMYAADRYNVAVDFGKLLDYVSHDRTLIRASAYAPISDDPTLRLDLQRFVQPFVNHGYRIVTKPLKRFTDGSIKANFDVELAMDILTMSDRLDIVTLVSGDGDFRRLVEIVASKGVRVEVVAFVQSTAAELKAIADNYVDLTQHLKDLCVPLEPDQQPRPRVQRPRIDI